MGMNDTKWTPGPWAVQVSEPLITSRATAFEIVTEDFDVVGGRVAIRNAADARLMAAAPDGFEAASAAYLAILKSPLNAWRVDQGMNGTLVMLRDFIALALDLDPEDVQAEYEAKARGES